MERSAGRKIVEARKGGSDGGKAELTAENLSLQGVGLENL
jgi:molybdenum-dependent DNA-binding transcriptional regulator ModE